MSNTRLRRLLADDLEECCDADVRERLTELKSLAEAVPDDPREDQRALSTLGDDTRYRLARYLAAGEELCVCELAPLVDVSDSAVSHALGDLADAGLATCRKESRWRYYRATPRAEALLDALDATRAVHD